MAARGLREVCDLLASNIRRGKIAFLAGAGISKASNLPLGAELSVAYVRAIAESPVIGRHHRDMILNAIRAQKKAARPELILQRIFEQVGNSIFFPLRAFSNASPTLQHDFLAASLASGNVVLTTNFDPLLEKSCRRQKVSFRPVLWRRDFEQLKISTAKRELHGLLIKIHGSLTDARGMRSERTITAALSQLANGLPPWKDTLLRHILQRYILVCLGYSGLDEFDIYSLLASVNTKCEIIWIDHRNRGIAKVVRARSGRRPTDQIDLLLAKRRKGFRIFANTGELLRKISKDLGFEERRGIETAKVLWQSRIMRWGVNGLNNFQRLVIIGNVLDDLGRPRDAIRCFKNALESSASVSERVSALLALGWNCESVGDFRRARQYFRGARSSLRGGRDNEGLARVHHSLGRIAAVWKYDFGLAESHYTKGLKLKGISSSALANLRVGLGNLHWLKGDWESAAMHYQEGLRAARRNLRKTYLVYHRLHLNLALAFLKMRKLKLAEKHAAKALEGFEHLGFVKGKAGCYDILASVSRFQGRVTDAIALREIISKIWKETNYPMELAREWDNLGILHFYKGNFPIAATLHRRAWHYFTGKRSSRDMAETASYMGSLYYYSGCTLASRYFGRAEQWYQRAVHYGRVSNAPEIVANCLTELAEVRLARNKVREAQRCLDRALALIKGRKDHAGLANVYRVRCRLAIRRGDLSAAFSAIERAISELAADPDLVERGRLHLAFAEALFAEGKKAKAKRVLRRVSSAFEKSSFKPGIRMCSTFFSRP